MIRTTAAAAVLALTLPQGAHAQSDSARSQSAFEDNDRVWLCGSDGFIPDHCLNRRSQGRVGVIRVFDERGPAEGVTHDPAFGARPCPQDPGASGGTWWQVLPGTWVCHRRGR